MDNVNPKDIKIDISKLYKYQNPQLIRVTLTQDEKLRLLKGDCIQIIGCWN